MINRLSRSVSFLFLIWQMALAAGSAKAAFDCRVSYDFLFADSSGFWFLEEMSGDCRGIHVKKIATDTNSVRVEEIHDWKGSPQKVLGRSKVLVPEKGLADQLVSPEGEWVITAPAMSTIGLLERRPPLLKGLTGKPVYWDGCGKYANYKLKGAFYSEELGLLVVITSSNWKSRDSAYEDCVVGDGLIVFKIEHLH